MTPEPTIKAYWVDVVWYRSVALFEDPRARSPRVSNWRYDGAWRILVGAVDEKEAIRNAVEEAQNFNSRRGKYTWLAVEFCAQNTHRSAVLAYTMWDSARNTRYQHD